MRTAQRRSKDWRDTGARDRLLHATRRCVRERGVADTSSRAITETAGVNLAAITYYFGSKDDLVALALADELRDWVEPALDRLSEPSDPVDRLVGAISVLNETFEAQRDRIPGLLEAFVRASRDEKRRGPLVDIWGDVRVRLSALLTELRSRGAIPSWVDPDAMASLIIAVTAGTVVNQTVDPGGVGHREVAVQFANLLVNARADA